MLIVGVGARRGAPAAELLALVDDLRGGRTVATVVTTDRKRDEPAVLALAAHLGAELRTYGDAVLAAQRPEAVSDTVARHVGVPSVAEASVLAAGGRVVARAGTPRVVVVLGEVPEGERSGRCGAPAPQ